MVVYFLQFATFENEPVTCSIRDNATLDNNDIIPIKMTGAGTPLKLLYRDNKEDKFTPIRALQLEINFLSDNKVNMSNFAGGDDGRWYVEVIYGTDQHCIFRGHLVTDDLKEDFICHPNIVTLTATDGLGLIRDIPLTDFNGNNPRGVYRIIDFIAFALSKTGLQLPINVMFNLRNRSGGHGFTDTFLEAKTFEDTIGTSINCYEALGMILGESCYLTQVMGEWWVVRVAEYMDEENTVFRFTHEGVGIGPVITQNWTYVINGEFPTFFSEESAKLTYIRPFKSVNESFGYEYPKEIIDNIDFERGAIFFPLMANIEAVDLAGINTSSPIYNSNDYSATPYHVEDWAITSAPGAITPAPYIKRVFYTNYEISRYVVIPHNPGTTRNTQNTIYMISSPIPVRAKDKVGLSVDFRLNKNYAVNDRSAHMRVAQIRLIGTNNKVYLFDNLSKGWVVISDFYGAPNEDIGFNFQDTDLLTDWYSVSAESKPVPVDGYLRVVLLHAYRTDNADKHFKNLQITYTPYINGGYGKYSGQYFRVTQEGNFKAKSESSVFVSDSPVKLFKGSLLRLYDSDYHPTDGWYNYAETQSPAPDNYHPFGWWQVYDVWNQHNRLFRSFEFTAQGIKSNDVFPTLVHRFEIWENNIHTRNKRFMLLHYELDLKICEWTGVLAEVRDLSIGKDYSSPAEFRYSEDR